VESFCQHLAKLIYGTMVLSINFYLFQANAVAEEDIGKIWNAINKQRKLQDEICEEIKKLKWGKFQDDDNNGDKISLLESKVKALEQAEKKKNIEIQDAFQKNGELFLETVAKLEAKMCVLGDALNKQAARMKVLEEAMKKGSS